MTDQSKEPNRTPRLRSSLQQGLKGSGRLRPGQTRLSPANPRPDDNLIIPATGIAQAIPFEEAAPAVKTSKAGTWALLLIVLTSLGWGIGAVAGFETALKFQMALGLVLAVVGLAFPSLGLLSIGMLSTLDAMATELLLTGGLLRYNTLNYLLILVMLLYLPFILRLNDFNTRALEVFALLLGLELIISSDVSSGLQDMLNIVSTFGLIVYFARSLKDENAMYWMGIVNGIFAGLGGLIFMLQFSSLPYSNPNNWSYFNLTALFSICVSFTYAHRLHKNKLILLALALVNVVWVFLSASRGSLLLALLCLLYLFLSTRSLTLKSVMIGLTFLLAMWVATQFVEQQSYTISRIQLLFDPTKTESTRTSKRSALMLAGLEIFRKNPLGIGTGSFREESAATEFIAGNRPAHSGWIKTLAENGVPGVILMAVFVGSFAIVGIRKHSEGKMLFGIFVTVILIAAFVPKEFRGRSLWFLIASGITLLNADEMKAFINQKADLTRFNQSRRLREIRFGRNK